MKRWYYRQKEHGEKTWERKNMGKRHGKERTWEKEQGERHAGVKPMAETRMIYKYAALSGTGNRSD